MALLSRAEKPIAPLPALALASLRGGDGPDPLEGMRTFLLARMAVRRAVERLALSGKVILAPDYHHGVEVEAVIAAGAQVRFYRVGRDMQVDLEDVERKSRGAAALYLTHYLGFPQPLAGAAEVCRRRGLLLIEDCALALLSRAGETPLGATGAAGIYCLYKTLPVPHGGALRMAQPGAEPPPPPRPVVARHLLGALLRASAGRPAIHAPLWLLRAALNPPAARLGVARVPVGHASYDLTLAEMSMAPVFRRQLSALDLEQVVARRRANYQRLLDLIGPSALGPDLPLGVCPLFYPLWAEKKESTLGALWRAGIGAVDFWRRPHPRLDTSRARDAQALRDHVVELPCHQDLGPQEMERIARVVQS